MNSKILPRITIVTPSYNQGRYIRETLESVINQDYENLEYFVVDGGSTDESLLIIKEHADRLDWWVSEKDKGQTDAVNKGFAKATGELLCWVNSDDVLFPGCLHAVAERFIQDDRPDIITSNIAYIDSESRITRFVRVPRQSRFLFFRGVWHSTAPCVFFKRSLFEYVGGLDAQYRLSMDLDIWMRMMKAKARIIHMPRYLGGFRWHSAAKTVQSINSRKTQENPETTSILNAHLAGSTPLRRFYWRKLYNAYQVLNGNYLLAYSALKRLDGHLNWKAAMDSAVFSSQRRG